MKRTLIALTAAIFASAAALPALAQDTSRSVTTRESTRTESYQSDQSSPSTVHTEREYNSERTSEAAAPVQAPSQVHIEKKVTTTTEVPPPAETTTTTTTRRTTSSY